MKFEIGKKTKELAEWKSQADASDGSKSVKLTQQDVERSCLMSFQALRWTVLK